MQKLIFFRPLRWLILLLGTPLASQGQLRLPRLCSDGMVLQRDTKINLWGSATPLGSVQVTFGNKTYQGQAGADGKWRISLPAHGPSSRPFDMTIKGEKQTLVLHDIVFGDVWVCSGQSNMEHDLTSVEEHYPGLADQADYTMIRQFKVQGNYDFYKEHTDFVSGSWQPATRDYIGSFTAVGFFFALDVYQKTKIPIGLINTSLGGSPVEAWLSPQALKAFPRDEQTYLRFRDTSMIADMEKADRSRSNAWFASLQKKDLGLLQNWTKLSADRVDWQTMSVPGYWADQGLGFVNGVVWFKKAVYLKKEELTGTAAAKLVLGRMVDADSVFFNGTYVGNTTYLYPRRRYTFNGNLLKAGLNTITIRIVNQGGKGGFVPDKPYGLVLGSDTISLAGLWKYKLGAVMAPMASQTTVRWQPGGLFNAMVAPLFGYPVKGVLWYQGESNADRPKDYASKMASLINSWRSRWHQPELPFLCVQLPGFMAGTHLADAPSGWAALREQQRRVSVLPATGMAVTIDLGEWNDVHPMDKQNVGHRLALIAEHKIYRNSADGSEAWTGPVFKRAVFKDGYVVLSFDQGSKGLKARDGESLQYFALAEGSGPFVWAKAWIHGDEVWVSSETLKHPTRVRYAWADNPFSANLVNGAGLPAGPFEAAIQ